MTAGFQHLDPAVIHAAAAAGSDLYPYAEYRPIAEATEQPTIEPWSFILHTMGGPGSTTPNSLWRYMGRADIRGECHLIFGYGANIQLIPFTVRADNNSQANSWWVDGRLVGAISVETQDDGVASDPGVARAPWNDYQMEHLAGTAAFLHLRYGVPLTRCTAWFARGVDGHRAHPEWSKYTGKTCPGDARWAQIPDVLRLAEVIVNWSPDDPPTPPQKGDMARINGFFVRFEGTEDHFLCIPQTGDSKARLEPDEPAPLTATADLDRLNELAGYPLTRVDW